MHVDATVEINPARQELGASYRVTGYPAESWWLHDGLTVVSAQVDGSTAAVQRRLEEPPSPFSPRVHAVEIGGFGEVLDLTVVGRIEQVEADVNAIGPDLVELATYAAWHPVFPSLPRFDYSLDLHLLGEGPIAVNGQRCGHRTQWRSTVPVFDITVVSAPSLVEFRQSGSPVRVLATESSSADRVLQLADQAVRRCTEWWGLPRSALQKLTVVLSPRSGWCYSRLPLILLAGKTHLAFGDQHTVLHEIGHLWWSVADIAGPDDWLNEGLAEYAADRLARELLPVAELSAYRAARLAELAVHTDDPAVLATSIAASDEVRYRNRYRRSSLALRGLEHMVGEGAVDDLLIGWHTAGTATPLTTEMAVKLAAEVLPGAAVDLLSRALTTPGWLPE